MARLDELMKRVVRAGKVVKKQVRIHKPKRLTPKQLAALKKARKKAHTRDAEKGRKKSNITRKKTRLDKNPTLSASLSRLEALIEAAKGREPLAARLLDRFKAIGVSIPKLDSEEYQELQVELSKLIDNLPTGTIALIHRGSLAPVIKVLVGFSSFPIKEPELVKALEKAKGFKKNDSFPFAFINFLAGKAEVLKREKGKTRKDSTYTPYNGNVLDIISFCKALGLDKNKLGV